MKAHTLQEIDAAAEQAAAAFDVYRHIPAQKRASLLRSIGAYIDGRRLELTQLAAQETSLLPERLQNEITRTVNQCFLFADLITEGSWIRAIIDTAVAGTDLRQMQIPIGPVAVFGASNFPFAYSVAGGDTIAALAAGCPVIYKVNPGHPPTSDAVADIVSHALNELNLPGSVFAVIHGAGYEAGMRLVTHPAIQAVGFTGSLKGGRALFDAAAKREQPIPVYAEMGSTNPVFLLPRILSMKAAEIADTLAASNTSSAGQFCTNPGIMIKQAGPAANQFHEAFTRKIADAEPAAMLNDGILNNFTESVSKVRTNPNVDLLALSKHTATEKHAKAVVFHTSSKSFLSDHDLWEEMFGPASIQVTAESQTELIDIAKALPGQITASIWGTEEDLRDNHALINFLQLKAGRLIINGVPAGVQVSPAMNHGGPYPATTDSKFTSVGTQSIYRFTRPICLQNYPQYLLPEELANNDPLNIWRMINGEFTKAPITEV